eukprot:2407947-Pyramimonas_sp.AAC.2
METRKTLRQGRRPLSRVSLRDYVFTARVIRIENASRSSFFRDEVWVYPPALRDTRPASSQ